MPSAQLCTPGLNVFVYVQVQKILQSSQQKEGLELQNLLTNPHVQVRYLPHIKCTSITRFSSVLQTGNINVYIFDIHCVYARRLVFIISCQR